MAMEFLGSRALLGVCAVLLVLAQLPGALGWGEASSQQVATATVDDECRDDLDAALVVAMAAALARIEEGLRAQSVGDEDWQHRAVSVSREDREAYAAATSDRASAVVLCRVRS